MPNISVTAFGVPGSTDSVVETQGGGINIDVKALYVKMQGDLGECTRLNQGLQCSRMRSTSRFFFFSVDLRSLKAAIKKTPEIVQIKK